MTDTLTPFRRALALKEELALQFKGRTFPTAAEMATVLVPLMKDAKAEPVQEQDFDLFHEAADAEATVLMAGFGQGDEKSWTCCIWDKRDGSIAFCTDAAGECPDWLQEYLNNL